MPTDFPYPRVSEPAAFALLSKGVRASAIRLAQIHDTHKQGLITFAVAAAREKGVSPYVGDGMGGWSAAHVSDVARLYRLALEKNEAGAKYHAVAEESVPWREIAEVIGRGLSVPVVSITLEEAANHFGWWGRWVAEGLMGSSAITKAKLGWTPKGPGLLSDLEQMDYSEVAHQ